MQHIIIRSLHRALPIKTTLSTFFSIVKFLLSFRRSKKLWTSSLTPSKEGIFFPLSSLGGPSSSSSLELINSGGFGAFLGCRVFLTFFPAFVATFFPSLDLNAFLGLCSSSLELSDLGDFGAFLGHGVFLAFLLHFLWRLIISISSILSS